MKSIKGPLSCLALLALGTSTALAGETVEAPSVDDGSRTATLTHRALPKWDIVLPSERWTPVGDAMSLGVDFATEITGPLALMVDTDGDGKLDSKVKGLRGFLKLRAKDADGETFTYATRFHNDGRTWRYAAGGAMMGKVEGTIVKVIDQNGDGDYDDYGEDAMIVGNAKAATLLSQVVNLDGALYHFEISADGRTVTYRPYEGETGFVDLASKYTSRGKLTAAIVSSRSGEMHFNAARSKKPFLVPAGDYEVSSGYAVRAGESVRIRTGKMERMHIEPNAKFVVKWGGPIVAEFEYDQHGEVVTVAPNVAFYGTAGEEYHTFQPDAKSPKILIADANTGKLLDSGRFGGC